jgi:hypothetical protein
MIVMLSPFGSQRAFQFPTHLSEQLFKYQASPRSCKRAKKLGYTILWIIWDLHENEYCLRDFDEKSIFVCSSGQAKFHKVLLILKEDTLLEASFGKAHKILNKVFTKDGLPIPKDISHLLDLLQNKIARPKGYRGLFHIHASLIPRPNHFSALIKMHEKVRYDLPPDERKAVYMNLPYIHTWKTEIFKNALLMKYYCHTRGNYKDPRNWKSLPADELSIIRGEKYSDYMRNSTAHRMESVEVQQNQHPGSVPHQQLNQQYQQQQYVSVRTPHQQQFNQQCQQSVSVSTPHQQFNQHPGSVPHQQFNQQYQQSASVRAPHQQFNQQYQLSVHTPHQQFNQQYQLSVRAPHQQQFNQQCQQSVPVSTPHQQFNQHPGSVPHQQFNQQYQQSASVRAPHQQYQLCPHASSAAQSAIQALCPLPSPAIPALSVHLISSSSINKTSNMSLSACLTSSSISNTSSLSTCLISSSISNTGTLSAPLISCSISTCRDGGGAGGYQSGTRPTKLQYTPNEFDLVQQIHYPMFLVQMQEELFKLDPAYIIDLELDKLFN